MEFTHTYSGSLQAAPSPPETAHAALARKAAAARNVLLRNHKVVPLGPHPPRQNPRRPGPLRGR